MKILCTGSSGVIGRELLPLLTGHEVLAIDRIEPEKIINNCQYITDEISTKNGKMEIAIIDFAPEIVFHLAASFERLEENADFYDINYADNIDCSHAIASWTFPKTFVFASSYLVYKHHSQWAIQQFKETDEKEPRNLCGAAKLYAEAELEFIQKHIQPEMNIVNARIFRSYGKGSRDIVSRWVRAMLKGEKVRVINPLNSFDYIYAGDVALALYKLSRLNKSLTVNVGTGISTTISEVYDTIFKENPTHFSVDENSVENTVANMSLLNSEMDWTTETTIQEGVKQIVEYERSKK
jgi:nucleoside-diphosphate-sugar epimerase